MNLVKHRDEKRRVIHCQQLSFRQIRDLVPYSLDEILYVFAAYGKPIYYKENMIAFTQYETK